MARDRLERHIELPPGVGPLIGLWVSLSRRVWRIGPAWSVIAGALASAGLPTSGEGVLQLIGAAGLADAAWGILWRSTSGSHAGEPGARAEGLPLLPYWTPTSPAARGLGSLQGLVISEASYALPTGLALTIVLSILLGKYALVLSALALVAILATRFFGLRGYVPDFWYAVLQVGLPWLLGWSLVPAGSSLAAKHAGGPILALAFVVLQWGLQRARRSSGSAFGGVWLGQLAVLAALIGLRQPWLGAVCAAIMLLPLLWVRRAALLRVDVEAALARGEPWWWAGLLLSAIAAH